jgi:metal-responsive CopG/Arc/MetJ family transcriptional regulator
MNYIKELVVMVQPELHKQFKETCTKNYKMISEVIRDFMIEYIKQNKK